MEMEIYLLRVQTLPEVIFLKDPAVQMESRCLHQVLKLQELSLSPDGLAANLVSFNVGVELGQLAALGIILLAFNFWRRSRTFLSGAWTANVLIMAAGFVLIGYQLAGYWRGA